MKNNPFGTKLTYNPVPLRWQIEITGEQQSGKSELSAAITAQLLGKNQIGLFIDPDGRSIESVPKNAECEFYPLSDNEEDMLNADRIEQLLVQGMTQVGDRVRMIIFDSVTNFIEPIINRIQRDQESGKLSKSAVAYREKATAMKTVRHVVNRYGTHTIWIYHTTDKVDSRGNKSVGTTLTDLETARLGRMVNLSLEVVVNDSGKRGVKVLEARRGRTGMVIWDESSSWQNIRTKIEQAVWQGLTEQEQDTIEESLPETFVTPAAAVKWAMRYSEQHGNFFVEEIHAQNSLKKLHNKLVEQLENEDYDRSVLWEMWVKKVTDKEVDE